MTRASSRPLRRRLAPLLLVAAALGLAGCGAGAAGKEATPAGPVEDQLGFDPAGIAERQSRVEAAIGTCMTAQGFEYVPVDPLAQRAAITGSSRLSDEDFLKQFGYGISTLYGRGGAQRDPNERIRQGLSGSDRAAYERTLWGESPGATFSQAVDTGEFTRLGGCTRKATEAVFGGAATLSLLQGRLDALDQRITQDQRMVRATEKWSSCMATAGYRYAEPDDVDAALIERFQAIVGRSVQPGETSATVGAPPDGAALAALQREEVATAIADLACEEREILPVENVVRPEYESSFRRENRDLLRRVVPAGS